jgi:hypothetical protein
MRPLTELSLTIVNKGYSGYFNPPFGGIGLKQGWGFNLSKIVNPWWSTNNQNSDTSIPVSGYTLTSGQTKTFYYNLDLQKGDVMDGDFCEWNDNEQIERVVSPYYHKMKFNQAVFATTPTPSTNAPGYYYKPHNPIKIRDFSSYIEEGDPATVSEIPDYAVFSKTNGTFIWRDIYTYGFVDSDGVGVDYPFLNGVHYPFTNTVFRLIPEGASNPLSTINTVALPTTDECE